MQRPPARLLVSVAVLAALSAGGCSTTTGTSSPDTTGSIATDTAPRSQVQWRQEMDSWGARYRANPTDPDAAIRYAQALRAYWTAYYQLRKLTLFDFEAGAPIR